MGSKRIRIIVASAVALALSGVVFSPADSRGRVQAEAGWPSGSLARPLINARPSATNPIVAENSKPGTSGWRIHVRAHHALEGFAVPISGSPGQPVQLYISSTSPTIDVQVFRLGWYQGLGGRLIWKRDGLSAPQQPAATVETATSTVQTHWRPTLQVPVGADWTPGAYVARLRNPSGEASYIPFIVNDSLRHAPILFKSSVATWEAYNLWGGHSLYMGRGPSGQISRAQRSTVVSFDRPFEWGAGAADLIGLELPLLSWLEHQGYDVGYASDLDLHSDPNLLTGRKVMVSPGHDEYWSLSMRDRIEAAQASGLNLAFFGANAMYRHVRFEQSPLGTTRRMINYRAAASDPQLPTNPADVTVDWRAAPVSRPESTVMGAMYECNPVSGSLTVHDPLPWLFNGTGLKAGDSIPGLLGPEYDRVFPSERRPHELWVLFRSPVNCRGVHSVQDTTFAHASSGAGVFNAGTSRFVCVFSGCLGDGPNAPLQQLSANLLDGFLGEVRTAPETPPRPFSVGPVGPTEMAIHTGLLRPTGGPAPMPR